MPIRATAPGQAWDGRSDTVIVRLASQNRMVTKGYRKGVYDRVGKGLGDWGIGGLGN